ncbi:hypothetical protein cyc_06980 [Cyclospora cayetanensis]|uniref:SprT-like domain-containing protein n=1 Tax=Cyclospora cayetanensis TaxID=88456 RepID=A0A1D3CYA7_9EIME|nr:hypothetical protein cyc_06980 [Cyclospora cayetanensis]
MKQNSSGSYKTEERSCNTGTDNNNGDKCTKSFQRSRVSSTEPSGGLLLGGPRESLKDYCISISSDSDTDNGDAVLVGCAASTDSNHTGSKSTSSINEKGRTPGTNQNSSSRITLAEQGAKQRDGCSPVLLIDSDEDSDYQKDLLAVLDSDDEPAGGSTRPEGTPLLAVASPSTILHPGGGAHGNTPPEFDFPCIYALFAEYNDRFFGGRLAHVEVKWSPRMTLCAGLCVYKTGGYCSVRLSEPLLKLRSVKELKNKTAATVPMDRYFLTYKQSWLGLLLALHALQLLLRRLLK